MATQSFSADTFPTMYRALPVLEAIMEQWRGMLEEDRFKPLHEGLEAALSNLEKWYHRMDETNVHIVSLGMLTLYLPLSPHR
jgi:hypothetical protein